MRLVLKRFSLDLASFLLFAPLFAFSATHASVDFFQKEYIDEINNFQLQRPIRRRFSSAEKLLQAIEQDLLPPAIKLCIDIGQRNDCGAEWDVELVTHTAFNAYASGKRNIVVFSGLVEQTTHVDEIAFVLAHEIGHHAHNHISETKVRATAGAIAGAILGGLTGNADIAMNAAQVGANVASLSYSSAQETEADNFAFKTLISAGYDPIKARLLLIRMSKMSGSITTPLLATHPSGPERLYRFDLLRERVATNELK